VDELCDDLIDDCISQGFLALEVVIERSLGDVGSGENGIDAGTLEARSMNLPKSRLQQALPSALRITESSLPRVPT
jgi:hypothetical protein